jgi:hypothetical protein
MNGYSTSGEVVVVDKNLPILCGVESVYTGIKTELYIHDRQVIPKQTQCVKTMKVIPRCNYDKDYWYNMCT